SLEELNKVLLPFFILNRGGLGLPTRIYSNMIAFLRSSLYRLRDTKAPSLHDRIDPWGPGSPEFNPPYTRVHELSEKTSRALVGQIAIIQVMELRGAYSQKMLLDILHLLDSLPSSLYSLTTVIFRSAQFSAETTHLIVSVLRRHPGVICLVFRDCSFDDRALIDDNIAMNRQMWREEAERGGIFTYRVGCEIRPGRYGNYNTPVSIYHYDILLSDFADLYAMVHIPQDGKVVPKLLLQAHQEDITIVASLTPSDKPQTREDGGSGGTLATQYDVAASYEFESISIVGFPVVKAGHHELRIRLARTAQYLFRKLTIDFIAAPDGVEPPSEPGAEDNNNF
ncbi:hypothetical protein PQX77_003236, partial [Marasmius sp. AFHP31]